MDRYAELDSWIKLWRVSGIGPKKFKLLLDYFDSPLNVFGSNEAALMKAGITQKDARSILDKKKDLGASQPDLDWLKKSDRHHIIMLNDPEYPKRLKEIMDPPAVLYVHGDINVIQDPQIGIVGSRNPTQSGANNSYEFAKYLTQTGFTVTSGMALGVDGASHQGALDGNGPTIAVIATGIDRVYPARHRDLAHKISQYGAIVTEFPLGTSPHARHFPRRNRIISAMSYGVLVVEAALKSGSLITARLAMEQNREVFAIPGSIHNPLAKGCHKLIRQGAKLVETAEDILEEMASIVNLNDHEVIPKVGVSERKNENTEVSLNDCEGLNNDELDPDQNKLLVAMEFEPISIDQLVLITGIDAASIAAMLLMLELKSFVVGNGGGTYTRVK